MPIVSIGMPVYNGEKTIVKALKSILSQTYNDFELIISDNNSTDATHSICKHYESLDKRVRYVRQPLNVGAAANFQQVLDLAVGEFFMWAAIDDFMMPNHLQTLVEYHMSHDCLLVSSKPLHVHLDTGLEYRMLEYPNGLFNGDKRAVFLRFMSLHHWNHAKACLIYGLYKRSEMIPICDYRNEPLMQDVGADLLYLYKVIASGRVECLKMSTWIRGERFWLGEGFERESLLSIVRRKLRIFIYCLSWIDWRHNSKHKSMKLAIDSYCQKLCCIYRESFGPLDKQFIRQLRENRFQLVSLLLRVSYLYKT